MSNVQARNDKLKRRAVRILAAEVGLDEEAAREALAAANGNLSVALVMSRTQRSREDATAALAATKGVVEQAITQLLA